MPVMAGEKKQTSCLQPTITGDIDRPVTTDNNPIDLPGVLLSPVVLNSVAREAAGCQTSTGSLWGDPLDTAI